MAIPEPLVTIHPDMLGGTPVFTGTRVPVHILFEYLEAGDALAEFLAQYPTVTRDHAIAVLKRARDAVAPRLMTEPEPA